MNIKTLLMNKIPWVIAALGVILLMFVTINTLIEIDSQWVQKPGIIQLTKIALMNLMKPSENEQVKKEAYAQKASPEEKPVTAKAGMNDEKMSPVAGMTDEPAEATAEETAKEESHSPAAQYHKKHIVVKFTPEGEKEIAQGNASFPGKPKRLISNRNIWQVEVGKEESVEKLLDKYKTEYSGKVQYAQLDYECQIQKKDDNDNHNKWMNVRTLDIVDEKDNENLKTINKSIKENEKLSKAQENQWKKLMKKGDISFRRNDLRKLNMAISKQKRTGNASAEITTLMEAMMCNSIILDFLYSSLNDYLGEKHMIAYMCDAEAVTMAGPLYWNQEASPFEDSDNNPYLQYLYDINIDDAWDETEGEDSVVIALVDTGIAYEDANIEAHEYERLSSEATKFKKAPGLQNLNLWVNEGETSDNSADDDSNGYVDDVNGFDFVDHDAYPHDDNGHGTYLANIIAYNDEDALGIAKNCALMPVKVLDHRGIGYASVVAEGIYYAVDHGADIINLSLAWVPGLDPGPIVHDAIIYAAQAGVIMVAGSGNNGTNTVCYPAAYPETIAVGATQFDDDHTRAYYSNYGDELEIMAPGGNALLDLNNDGYADGIVQEILMPKYQYSLSGETLANPSEFGYAFLQGTSVSTAIVSGVVGLILSEDPNMGLAEVRNLLYTTATKIGDKKKNFQKEYGYGLINAGAAIAVLNGRDIMPEDPLPEDPNSQDPAAEDPNSEDAITEDPNSEVPAAEETPSEVPPTYYWDNPVENTECLDDEEIETECDLCLDDEEVEYECAPASEPDQTVQPTECLDDEEIETECDLCLDDEEIEEECT